MRLSLERLMAAAGHELKTPTAAIHNYLQLVERRLTSGDTAEAATYAARAVAQARRLNDLVERLFDVSRIQTGQLEIVVEPVDLVAIVRAATDVSAVLADAPMIRFSAKPASLIVRGDAGRLEQVFLNLLSNAVEHAAGSGAIDVVVRRSGRVAVVEVRDHGRGIAAEDLSVVFEAYTRLRQRQRATGLGLGLFVSREIVAAHGGTITATSQIGDGTTISVRLPAAPRASKPFPGGAARTATSTARKTATRTRVKAAPATPKPRKRAAEEPPL
jgi:signal transduction histidine kinase